MEGEKKEDGGIKRRDIPDGLEGRKEWQDKKKVERKDLERSGAGKGDYRRGVGGKVRVRERRGEIERDRQGTLDNPDVEADGERAPYSAHFPTQGGAVTALRAARALVPSLTRTAAVEKPPQSSSDPPISNPTKVG